MTETQTDANEISHDLKVWPVDVNATCAKDGCTHEATHRTDVELDLFDDSLTETVAPPFCAHHAKHYARMFDNWE